jgi:hypothetical protein
MGAGEIELGEIVEMKKSDGFEAGHRWTFCEKPRVVEKTSYAFGCVYVHFVEQYMAVETTDMLDDPNWVYVGPPEAA